MITRSLYAQDRQVALLATSIGYLHEDFRWSIAGANDHPNIYSELKWKRLKAPVFTFDGAINVWDGFVLTTKYSYGIILAGDVNDRDYLEDNRTVNIYDGNFNGGKGAITSLNINAGYKVWQTRKITLIPSIGYTRSEQHLFLLGNDPSSQNLRSTYDTNWKGANFTVETTIHVSRKIDIVPVFNYQQLKFKSEADWNLIQNFKHPISFAQKANGFLLGGVLTACYWFHEKISLSVNFSYSRWDTGHGVDRLYLQDGTTSETRFNEAFRQAFSIGAGVKYRLLK